MIGYYVEQLERIAEGLGAPLITGKTPQHEREELYDRFRAGALDVLCVSKVANFAAACVGDELTVRARVAANYEKKGHRLVDLDALVIANGRTLVARVLHIAVYQLRQLA